MDLTKMTLAELREFAKEKGIKGITALRKPELAARIAEVLQTENKKENEKSSDWKKDNEKARPREKSWDSAVSYTHLTLPTN